MERNPADSSHSPRTWTITDGHAGNVRQAQALARALGGPVERELALRPGRLARWLAPRRWPGAEKAFGADFARALGDPPALAIGCGRQAALATRLLRGRVLRPAGRANAPGERCRTVQILDPRLDPSHWDLVIAPEHDGLRGDNVLTLLGSLHPVDDAWLAGARARFDAFLRLPAPRTALLVGGGSRHAAFGAAHLDVLLALLDTALSRDGGSLLLTASRRTDPELFAPLRAFAARWPGVCWLGEADGDNPYPGLLACADRIVCTADSVNMVSEASATRAPVFVFDPGHVGGRPRRFLDALLARGRICAADAVLAPFQAEPLRETARVAAEVHARLPRMDGSPAS